MKRLSYLAAMVVCAALGQDRDVVFEERISPILKATDRVREVDQPVAALLKDLKQRGMFDDTLVVWTSEMGRTPFAEAGTGRNHNQWGLVSWFAGGGIRGGADCGGADDFGLRAAADPIPIRDVHATVLQLLGFDNNALTYLHEGRYKRLTDTDGRVIKEILS